MRHFPATGFPWIDNRFTITMLAVVLFLILSYAVVQLVEKPLAPLVREWLSAPQRSVASFVEGQAHG
jgi:peptidoglycan/LPS O-acetylase OafA/YrhL